MKRITILMIIAFSLLTACSKSASALPAAAGASVLPEVTVFRAPT